VLKLNLIGLIRVFEIWSVKRLPIDSVLIVRVIFVLKLNKLVLVSTSGCVVVFAIQVIKVSNLVLHGVAIQNLNV
jgi:hypothetical protein